MARKYPRFIFSNPANTKSEGPFVVHLLKPRLVFKVIFDQNDISGDAMVFSESDNIGLSLLDPISDPEDQPKIYKVLSAGIDWLIGQVRRKEITL